jgi:hypothetical protein
MDFTRRVTDAYAIPHEALIRDVAVASPVRWLNRNGVPSSAQHFSLQFYLILVFLVSIFPAHAQSFRWRSNGADDVHNQGMKNTEDVFKNIRVLKGIPSDQLIPAMQFMSSSLGVACSFCHVEGHSEKDDKKPKQTAREMMQMMFDLNRNNFEGLREVTCNSCHRGSRNPVSTPLVAGGAPRGLRVG